MLQCALYLLPLHQDKTDHSWKYLTLYFCSSLFPLDSSTHYFSNAGTTILANFLIPVNISWFSFAHKRLHTEDVKLLALENQSAFGGALVKYLHPTKWCQGKIFHHKNLSALLFFFFTVFFIVVIVMQKLNLKTGIILQKSYWLVSTTSLRKWERPNQHCS